LTAVNLSNSSGSKLSMPAPLPAPPIEGAHAMSMLTRWNPFKSQSGITLLPEFDQFVRNFGSRSLLREFDEMPEMRIDLAEDEHNFFVTADLPGMDKDAISVAADGNLITISAETSRETERKEEKRLVTERYSGRCYRSFSLPVDVDQARAEAHYEKGVLKLTLPKKSNGESRQIRIS
jgi:HSP20 family protein